MPKVSHPRPPKHLMDPISPKQLLGFQKMVRRIPHALTFEEALEYRPLLSHFRDCRETIEEIEVLFLEARHTPPLRKLKKRADPGIFSIPCSISGVEFKESLVDSGVGVNVMSSEISERLGAPASIDTHEHRSTQLRSSESAEHEAPASIDTHDASIDTAEKEQRVTIKDDPIDRCTSSIDRHKASQEDAIQLDASIDTPVHRSTHIKSSEFADHEAPVSIDTPKASIDTAEKSVIDTSQDPSIDRCNLGIDRRQSKPAIPNIEKLQSVEERAYKSKVPFSRNPRKSQQELYEAKCRAIMNKLTVEIPVIDAIKTTPVVKRCLKKMLTQDISKHENVMMTSEVGSAVIQNRIPEKFKDSTLHPPPKKQRYTLPEPKPPDFINKTFRGNKTVLQLTTPRDYRRVLVSLFDADAGKRSVPPILTSHPSAGPHFLGRPHALNAYKPPWMRRIPSARHSLPHSRPPDA